MDLPKRKQNRLKEYDYSTAGAYFVTICTHERRMLFGDIVGAIHESPLQHRSLISKIIGYLKMNVSRDIHQDGYSTNVWQRSYHDHVIRDERDYRGIWDYIEDNPRKWAEDRYYTDQ